MQASEFVQAFRRETPVRHARAHDDILGGETQRELEATMARGREFANQWGQLLYDHLDGREPPTPQEFIRFSNEYTHWFIGEGNRLTALAEQFEQQTEAGIGVEADGAFTPGQVDPARMLHALTEYSFHRLNLRCGFMWNSLLFGELNAKAVRRLIARARFELASDVLLFSGAREQLLGAVVEDDDEARELRAWHTGMLTEIDAMIALLDVTRQAPQTVVLPAPPQFERFAGPANADMIVIDTQIGEVVGVQVKASGSWKQASRYDARRVVMLDGVLHLENSRAMRTNPRRSDRYTVSWPGLVGAHYLRSLPLGRVDRSWAPRRQVLNMKLAARHYVGDVADRNDEVFSNCVQLVRPALTAARNQPQVSQNGSGGRQTTPRLTTAPRRLYPYPA